jgi:hypothetical protein
MKIKRLAGAYHGTRDRELGFSLGILFLCHVVGGNEPLQRPQCLTPGPAHFDAMARGEFNDAALDSSSGDGCIEYPSPARFRDI